MLQDSPMYSYIPAKDVARFSGAVDSGPRRTDDSA